MGGKSILSDPLQPGPLPGRLPPGEMFPAGYNGYRVSFRRLGPTLRLRIVESGPEDGKPVLLIPGWASTAFVFHATAPSLAAAGLRVICFDPKGSGLSSKPLGESEYTTSSLVSTLRDLLDELEVAQCGVAGHSMGGSVAMRFALAYPERVSHLGLLSPVGYHGVPLLALYRLLTPAFARPLLPVLATRLAIRIALRRVFGARGPSFPESDVDQYWAPTQFPAFSIAQRDSFHAYDWIDVDPDASPLPSMPALLVYGGADRLLKPGYLARYRALLPRLKVLSIPDACHIVHEEAAGTVNEELVRLFRE